MIYIFCFVFSSILFFISDKCRKSLIRRIFVFFAILLPCLLASLRSQNIGTDVNVYVAPLYNAAIKSDNFLLYMSEKWYVIFRYKYVKDIEIGFSLMVFLVSRIFGSLSVVLFVIHAFIIIPLYLGLKRLKDKCPIWFGMLVFYFLFYNTSLNMMRQWIAMSFIFLGFSYLVCGNRSKCCLFIAIACLFHTSAIIGFIILLIYILSTPAKGNIKFLGKIINPTIIPVFIAIIGCIALFSLNLFAMILDSVGLHKYVVYIKGDHGVSILPNQIILRLPIIILYMVKWNKLIKKDSLTNFYGCMITLDLLTSQLMSINEYAFRIGSYFSEYNIILYSSLAFVGNRKKRLTRFISMTYIIGYIVCYWLYYYVISGYHMTFPYAFA